MMSSLFIGASGMRSLGEGMGVITNNLANQSTIGFKQSMMLYQDLTSQTVPTRSNFNTNISQAGMGVAPGTVRTLFLDGGLETTNTVTDLGITGLGYFGVTDGTEMHYTRAGNFRFTKDGDLIDPQGFNLVGHAIVNGVEEATATPIKLDMTGANAVMQPKGTSAVLMSSNLGGTDDKAADTNNPFFALASSWDGTQPTPLGSGSYSYGESISVYDNAGEAHDLRIYYDYAGEVNGKKVYEYVIGADPSEAGNAGSKGAGLFMAGTLSFDSQGQLQGMTAFTPGGDPADLSSWQQASLDNGLPQIAANFAGAGSQNMTIDFGLNMASGWNSAINSPTAGSAVDKSAFYAATPGAVRSDSSTTGYSGSYSNKLQRQDGYGQGDLYNLKVDPDGLVHGLYNNGQTQELYRVGLYRFTSQDGLRAEGKNHFSATTDSGEAQEGRATDENFGSINSQTLEQSNVDMAREFAQMIITQRGFQMNSKVVTTADQMLQKALELKR